MSLGKSQSFQTWEYQAILPLPFGDVRLQVLRYKHDGPKMVLIQQVKALLGLSKDTFKEHCMANNVCLYKEDDTAILRRLAEVGVVQPNIKLIYITKTYSVIKMVRAVGAWGVLQGLLEAAHKSEPSVSANERGTQALQRATAPWQPLPLTQSMELAVLELESDHAPTTDDAEEEDVEDEKLTDPMSQTRMDRGPAFVSSQIGR